MVGPFPLMMVVTVGFRHSAHPQALHQGRQLWQREQNRSCVGSGPALPRDMRPRPVAQGAPRSVALPRSVAPPRPHRPQRCWARRRGAAGKRSPRSTGAWAGCGSRTRAPRAPAGRPARGPGCRAPPPPPPLAAVEAGPRRPGGGAGRQRAPVWPAWPLAQPPPLEPLPPDARGPWICPLTSPMS